MLTLRRPIPLQSRYLQPLTCRARGSAISADRVTYAVRSRRYLDVGLLIISDMTEPIGLTRFTSCKLFPSIRHESFFKMTS